MRGTCAVFVLLIQTTRCLASDDSAFQLTNKNTGFCLFKINNDCQDVRWTTKDRLLVPQRNKCLGAQGTSVGSEISQYECDETNPLQRWECKNETVLALKGQELYIELTADNTAVLSRTIGPNNHLTISGMSSGACTRTFRELYAIGGNAAGMTCMFPFLYKDQWYSDCTTFDSPGKHLWCAVETKFQNQRWGYCPVTSKEDWHKHPTTGVYYQLNTQSALTWSQAEFSCKQQGASLLSITDPHEQAYVTALLGAGGNKLWTGLIVDQEHGWKWSNGRPYRYLKWDSGHPLSAPGYNCAVFDVAVQYSWQSSSCGLKLPYICYSEGIVESPTQAAETGFCSSPWILYNGHCFYLNHTMKTWSDAKTECRKEGGDLVSIRNVEDQSFIISRLGYATSDELWIGLNDRKTERLFDWSDQSTVSFTSWEFGKPAVSTDVEDCVLIRGENGNWADRVCEERHGFICMMKSAREPSGDEVQQDLGCNAGWRRHASYCYFIGMETKTFDEAKEDCKSSGSYLADVSNGVDNAFLVSLVGMRRDNYFWIGLTNQRDIEEFVWTNTNSVRFTHWNAEMPGRRQGCVAMKTGIFAGLWDLLPCTNREKYICKHLAEGAVLTPAPPTLVPPSCPNDWKRIGTRNYCSKLFTASSFRRTWYQARDYCRALGGDLVSIHSAEELQTMPDRYDTVWIGLSAPDLTNGYVWSDGSPLQFQHWEDGEPNNKNNVESCAEMKLHWKHRGGSWNDVHCESSHGFVCQIRAGLTPKPSPPPITPDFNMTSDGWLEWNGTQYFITSWSAANEDARQFCQQRHGDLATINSEAESVFLWKQTYRRSGSFWIGLTVDFDGSYAWMDGSPVVFQRWDEHQPDFLNFDEHCAVMTTSMGFWHDYNCGYEHGFICKRSGSPPANTTVAPTVPPQGGCPQNWKKVDSKCYNIINSQKKTWDAARKTCQEMGGNLASILSKHVQAFLTNEMAAAPTTDLWIGLHNIRGNPFYWTDGRPMKYSNWESQNNRHHSASLYHPDFMMDYEDYRIYEFGHFGMHHRTIHEYKCALMTTDTDTGIGKWKAMSCNDTNGFVCLKNLDPSHSDSTEPTPTGFVKLLNDSLKVVTQQMTWYAAKKYCEGDGAKLASLRSQWTQNYIELQILKLNTPLWIGLNRNETGGYFKFIGGWPMTYSNWGFGEPKRLQPCVYVDIDGQWKTADCNQNKNSVCMKTTDVAPTESSEFPGFCPNNPETSSRYISQVQIWLPFKRHCYLIITQRTEWSKASADCVRHGGSLLSIEDPSEQEFIAMSVKMHEDSLSSFWIGMYKTHQGSWLWLDKTVVDYTNWDVGQPNQRYDNSYGVFNTRDGTWHTGRTWNDKAYICKTLKVLQVPLPTPGKSMVDPKTRHHILAVVLVFAALALGAVIALFFFRKSGGRLPIPEKLHAFDNPLFSNNERSQPGLVDPKKLVENAEEENVEPILTV